MVESEVDGAAIFCIYAHMSQRIAQEGESVSAGQLIGYSGSTGNSTGPHLHFEVRVGGYSGGTIVNPGDYIDQSLDPLDNPDPHLPDYNYGPAVTLPEGDGEYAVMSALDPLYALDVYAGSPDHGANVQIYSFNGTAAQRWRFTGNGDGTYTVTNVKSGCALDVSGASTQNGANVQQYPPNGSDAQKWWVEDCGDGTYALKAVHSWGFLDVTDAVAGNLTNVQQWQGNDHPAQRWIISKRCGDLASLPGGDGDYTVASVLDPRLMLDVCAASADDGANVQVYGANGSAAQRFSFARNGDGSYIIRNAGSGKALDVAERSLLDGANVQQWEGGTSPNQRWWLEDCGDGSYCIKSVCSGRSLDVAAGVASPGTNVQQWSSNVERQIAERARGTLNNVTL